MKEVYESNLVYNIRYLREKHSLSRSNMAKRLEIDLAALNKIESGIYPPRLGVAVMYRIWEQFQVPPRDLIDHRLDE